MRPHSPMKFSDADVMRYLEVFYRRRWFVIGPAVAGLFAGILLGGILPRVYESSTAILVSEEKIMNPLIQGLAVSTSAASRLPTLREEILSWHRLVRLVEELQLANHVQTQIDFERLIMDLRNRIKVGMRGSELIRISYQTTNPAEAQQVVKSVMATFIDENTKAQTKEAGVAIDFLQSQMRVYRRKIKEGEISKMEEKLRQLLVDSTEAHPLVIDLREKMQRAQKDMETTERTDPPPTPILDPLYEQVREMITTRQGIPSEPEGIVAGALQPPPGVDPQLFNLYVLMNQTPIGPNDTSVNIRIYNQLLSRMETARITQQLDASKEGTRYSVLDPPRLPLKPVSPNRPMLAFLCAFSGVLIGAGLILLLEMADRSFHTAEDVAEFTQVPVVGVIGTIMTNSEVARAKAQQRFTWVVISGLLATALVGSYLISWIRY